MNILEQIAADTKVRIDKRKENLSLSALRQKAEEMPRKSYEFEKALRLNPDVAFICECKKASPSKGLIAPVFDYLKIAKEYDNAGADAISVLTEPKYFLGDDRYLKEIAEAVSIPCLRKDFTVDEYMIYEARILGASAVLLIVSLLGEETIRRYLQICEKLGLSALVETHDEEEVKTALSAGARIIGVNNRNLKDFSVSNENSIRLREMIPKDVIYVSESGIKNAEDVQILRKIGVDAVLVGETMMRADNKAEKLRELRAETGI